MVEFVAFLTFIMKDVSPGNIVEQLTVTLTIFFVAKRYFSKKGDEIAKKADEFSKKADGLIDAVSDVKKEMIELNTKVGDLTRGLELVETSHRDRISKLEFQVTEMGLVIRERILTSPVPEKKLDH